MLQHFFKLFEFQVRDVSKAHMELRLSDAAFVYDIRSETLFFAEHHSAAHRVLGLSLLQFTRPEIRAALIHGRTYAKLGEPVHIEVFTYLPELPGPMLASLHQAFGDDAVIEWPGKRNEKWDAARMRLT